METLKSLLQAHINKTLDLETFAGQFIDYWNDIRVEQNKAIHEQGIRPQLDILWKQYQDDVIDEASYAEQWHLIVEQVHGVRVTPHSSVDNAGNELYNKLILFQESENLHEDEVPTPLEILTKCKDVLDIVELNSVGDDDLV